jgi:RHS repeat-associated protein
VNGAFSQSYVYGSYIDEPLLKIDNAGNKIYYHANNLFSIAALTDNAGTVVERYKYAPYGKATVLAADGVTVRVASLYGNPWQDKGRRLDMETDLMFHRTRYYDMRLGQFMNRSPWEYIQHRYNLYDYCDANPVVYVEPFSSRIVVEASTHPPELFPRTRENRAATVDEIKSSAEALRRSLAEKFPRLEVVEATPNGGDLISNDTLPSKDVAQKHYLGHTGNFAQDYGQYDDVKYKDAEVEELANELTSDMTPGGVIGFHECYTAKAYKRLIAALRRKGFTVIAYEERVYFEKGKCPQDEKCKVFNMWQDAANRSLRRRRNGTSGRDGGQGHDRSTNPLVRIINGTNPNAPKPSASEPVDE